MTEQEYIRWAESLKEQLHRTVAVYLGSPSDAVDAVDEAFYKGFLAYSKLRQPEFFDTWLTRILINVCNSELRRRKRELAVAELPETAQEEFDALPLKGSPAPLAKGSAGCDHPALLHRPHPGGDGASPGHSTGYCLHPAEEGPIPAPVGAD